MSAGHSPEGRGASAAWRGSVGAERDPWWYGNNAGEVQVTVTVTAD